MTFFGCCGPSLPRRAPGTPYRFVEAPHEVDLIRQGVQLRLKLHLGHVDGIHVLQQKGGVEAFCPRQPSPSPRLYAHLRAPLCANADTNPHGWAETASEHTGHCIKFKHNKVLRKCRQRQ